MSFDFDFSLYWKKDGQTITKTGSKRTYRSQNIEPTEGNWIFNGNGHSIYLLEHFRQAFPKDTDLSKYTLGIEFNQTEGLPEKESWLAVGDHAMKGKFVSGTNRKKIEFNLSGLKDGLIGSNQGVRQFTFIPYTEKSSKEGNIQYFGKRVVSITTGPDSYNEIVPSLKTAVINTSQIKTFKDLKDKKSDILPDFTVTIGGIADLLLNKGYEKAGGLPDGVSQYHLIVDDLVDTSKKLLAQSILVTYNGNNPTYKKKFGSPVRILLENDIPWFVTGSENSIIDSRAKFDQYKLYKPNVEAKFYNTALELQSSFKGKIPTSNTPSNRAISVAGITFKDNAKVNRSAIQLNGYNDSDGSYDWWVKTKANQQEQTYWQRIKTAIDNYVSGNSTTQFFNQGGKASSPVYMYDNQISTWSDGSDGPETLAPYSLFERNFQMVTDDNIKVLTGNSQWKDMTLIQGNTGSAVSMGSYGFTNGNVSNNKLTNISIPRIAQYNPFDYINGVISNKSIYGKPLQGSNNYGIDGNTIGSESDKSAGTGIYVNSWNKDGTSNGNINAIRDIGILSALNRNIKFDALSNFPESLLTSNERYALGNNHFSYSITDDIFYDNKERQLMYAFGTNDNNSVTSPKNVFYSGQKWNTMTKWDTGLGSMPDNALKLNKSLKIHATRIDQNAGLVTIGLEKDSISNTLLSSAKSQSKHIAALTAENINSDQQSENWQSTEGLQVGPLSSAHLDDGTYKPYAIHEDQKLAIETLHDNGNSVDVHFEKNIQVRFFTSSTGSWLNDTPQSEKIYLNIKRLGRLITSLGFYECDPVTGEILIAEDSIKPGEDGYMQQAMDLSKSSNLFFTGKDMPGYKSEVTISDITDFKPNAGYGLFLSVDGQKNILHSSFSSANPGNAIQMISTASQAGAISYAFEDILVSNSESDRDYNDLIVTIGAESIIPDVKHDTNPTGFMIDYDEANPNLIDLYQNTVYKNIRATA